MKLEHEHDFLISAGRYLLDTLFVRLHLGQIYHATSGRLESLRQKLQR